MKWFKHESDAHSNMKLQVVIEELGLGGFGYYSACVELVASQGNDYRISRDKHWELYFQKILGVKLEKQKEFLIFFAKKGLIDRESLKKGELYIPKLEERCDEYTLRNKNIKKKDIGILSGESRDNVRLNRIEEKREEKKRPNASLEYLQKIPESDMQEFLKRFDASERGIRSKAEDLVLWCKTNGHVKKDYKMFLLKALKKDFPERKTITPKPEVPKEVVQEDEDKKREGIKSIREDLEKRGILTPKK